MSYSGVVKSYNEGNGYGFIECAETFELYGRDVFLHRREYETPGLNVGSAVSFSVTLSDKGHPRAVRARRRREER